MDGSDLTQRQRAILDFIVESVEQRGYPPAVREIGQAVGLASPSTVHAHLQTLEDRGYLRRDPTKPRAIEVHYDAALEGPVERRPARHVPLVGDVAAGTNVLAFSNQFQIATRDEPMSVQHGVIAGYSKLHGRKGVFDVPYTGDVYVIDAITNNPGAGGGVITNRKGELIGIIGKELRNSLTNTWINYAVPIQMLTKFVIEGKAGKYKPIVKPKNSGGPGGYHGIVLVPNVVERTPPYIEEVLSGSPAAKAGLKPDDLIVYVDGEQVLTVTAFKEILAKTRPGAAVKLEIRRVDKTESGGADRLVTVDLKLGDPPPETVKKEAVKKEGEKGRGGEGETKKRGKDDDK